jgi:hypothetical protein
MEQEDVCVLGEGGRRGSQVGDQNNSVLLVPLTMPARTPAAALDRQAGLQLLLLLALLLRGTAPVYYCLGVLQQPLLCAP